MNHTNGTTPSSSEPTTADAVGSGPGTGHGTHAGMGLGAQIDADVAEALDQLAEIHEHTRHLYDTVLALQHLTLGQENRVGWTPRWTDVPVAHRLIDEASSTLSHAGLELERLDGAATAAYLLGVLAAAATVAQGHPPRRTDVLTTDTEVSLATVRAKIAALDVPALDHVRPDRDSQPSPKGGSYLAFRVTQILDDIDAVMADDDRDRAACRPVAGEMPLAELRVPGFPHADELLVKLREFAHTLHLSLARARHQPARRSTPHDLQP